jgi:hypothetical protein
MNKEQIVLHIESILRKIRELDEVTMPAMVARKLIEAEQSLEDARKMMFLK